MAPLTLLDGIEPEHAGKLRQAGIRSTGHLLQQCQTDEGRLLLSQKTGFDPAQIDQWVRLADLVRVRGVGTEYAGLLAAAGADTVFTLALRDPAQLRRKMASCNRTGNFVQCLPSEQKVRNWVEQARRMVRIIGY